MKPLVEIDRRPDSSRQAPPSLPFVSIIVPVRNEARFITSTLKQLLTQDYPPNRFEILVADGQSTDATRTLVAQLAEKHAHVRLLDNPRRWSSAGRNVAAQAARGDIILVIDGHCQIDHPGYLADLVEAFEKSQADCIGRPQPLEVGNATTLQRAIALARASRLGHHPASHIYSECEGFVPPQSVAVAYRRQVFEQIGWFDEQFDACEDVEFNHRAARAGLSCYFTPGLRVYYHPRATLTGLFRQMNRYGRGRVRLLRKHPETFSLASFLPALFVMGVVLGPAVCLLMPILWSIYLGTLTLYLLLVLGTSLEITLRTQELRLLPWLPLVFLTVHAGAGAGVCWEVLAGKRHSVHYPVSSTVEAEGGSVTAILALPMPSAFQRGATETPRATGWVNALTIDVEEYFHVSSFENVISEEDWETLETRVGPCTERILELLSEAKVRATFFILGWVAERQPSLVRAIQAAGHEIGCHSYAHRRISTQTPEQFREDLRRGIRVLEDTLGAPISLYRAPSFSLTARSLWALDILIEEGIRLDSSIYPIRHDRYGFPGAPLHPYRVERGGGFLWEFPPPVWSCLGCPVPVGGGGYLRLYPYAWTRWALQRINDTGRPFATYLHPWELDPGQPRVRAGWLNQFRHYVNLHHGEDRLVRLLQDFSFGTLTEALHSYDPSVAQTIAAGRKAA